MYNILRIMCVFIYEHRSIGCRVVGHHIQLTLQPRGGEVAKRKHNQIKLIRIRYVMLSLSHNKMIIRLQYYKV